MKLIAQVRLYPTKDQYAALKQMLETANAACDFISARALQAQVFHRYGMQNLTYYEVRERFNLSAQMVIRCLAKVAALSLCPTMIGKTPKARQTSSTCSRRVSTDCASVPVMVAGSHFAERSRIIGRPAFSGPARFFSTADSRSYCSGLSVPSTL